MRDNTETVESLRRKHLHLADHLPSDGDGTADESAEESFAAFGALRGLHERALTIEFRFLNGNTKSFPYGWLGPVSFNASVGLLCKFTGDLVYLVVIRGSNLDTVTSKRPVNLTDRGINRHRVTWVREMDEDQIAKAGEGEPTVDRIEVAEFESNEDLQKWLKKTAPAFVG
jgi:hypothetical protein